MRKIILASQSPRRRELLKDITDEFSVVPSNCDETVPEDINPHDIPQFLALMKAKDVAKSYENDIVIGSDTIVIVDNEVLNKPKDEEDAKQMLRKLSHRRHSVVTGCALVCGEKSHSFSVETEVEFFKLTEEEIDKYVLSGDPMDKAGAYGVQSKGKTLVKGIYGDYFNVVGLPVGRLKREIETFIENL